MVLAVKKRILPLTNRNHPETLINETGDLYIIVHETGNTAAGAGARMHADFVYNGGGSSSVSFHLTVDQVEAYQMMAFKWIGWHASDGCNSRSEDWGCFRGIAIETCVNDGNRYKDTTRRNLAELISMIIAGDPALDFGGVDHRRFSVDRIRTHNQTAYDSKWCPTYMLNDGYIPTLVGNVRMLLQGTTPATGAITRGDTVRFTANLNVRTEPSLADIAWTKKANVVATLPAGTTALITEGPIPKDGHNWYNVTIKDFGTGFVSGAYLEKVVVPVPAPVVYAPRRIVPELAALTVADRDTAAKMVLKNGVHFITVWDNVKAKRKTPNLQFAYDGAKITEADAPAGATRWVSHLFQADNGKWYYYDERGNRLIADDWDRIDDAA